MQSRRTARETRAQLLDANSQEPQADARAKSSQQILPRCNHRALPGPRLARTQTRQQCDTERLRPDNSASTSAYRRAA
jgi:hypothetical protein